ncbi:MAG: signal peptidase I [Phycisphaeraceae bacterium JB051]
MKHTATKKDDKSSESFKETFESIVMAFILAFVFRAFVVEAFVIPTGSMAPTLLGQHADVTCPQCGYRFSADLQHSSASPVDPAYSQSNVTITCPMCSYPVKSNTRTQNHPGDRILVHKFIYNISEPKRWDVVVFKYPGTPTENFIKRLVGLPEEKLFIIDGNVFTQPLDAKESDPWQIQRKTSREIVQRTVFQPVYHSAFYPLDDGQVTTDRRAMFQWKFPWQSPQQETLTRTHRTFLDYDGSKPLELTFNYQQMIDSQVDYQGRYVGWYPYGQLNAERSNQVEPIEDIRVAMKLAPSQMTPSQSDPVELTFQTTGRIDDVRPVPIRATIAKDGTIQIATADTVDVELQTWTVRASDSITPVKLNRAHAFEFWFVDQEVSLWIDKRKALTWQYDVPLETLIDRPSPPVYPTTSVKIQGSSALITQLDLDRDLYYSTTPNRVKYALGGMYKRVGSREGDPVKLQADQFFCLGDNSPFSQDSRYWADVNPWIEKRFLSDKNQVTGVVPRELMIGKAFFVYFPAPHRINANGPGIIPNFGDIRFIH